MISLQRVVVRKMYVAVVVDPILVGLALRAPRYDQGLLEHVSVAKWRAEDPKTATAADVGLDPPYHISTLQTAATVQYSRCYALRSIG